MERLKKIIENELKKLDIDERDLLRKTALSTIENLINIVEKRMNNFEKTILDTAIQKYEDISVGSLMVPKSELYLYEVDYTPILKSDLEEIDLKKLLSEDRKEKIFKRVFIKLDLDRKSVV